MMKNAECGYSTMKDYIVGLDAKVYQYNYMR